MTEETRLTTDAQTSPPTGPLAELPAGLPVHPDRRFVSSVVELDNTHIHATWTLPPIDHWVLSGHFPGQPITPGVMLMDAVEQASMYLATRLDPDSFGAMRGVRKVKFRRQTRPGETLDIFLDLLGAPAGPPIAGLNAPGFSSSEPTAAKARVLCGDEIVCTFDCDLIATRSRCENYPPRDLPLVLPDHEHASPRPLVPAELLRQAPPIRLVDRVLDWKRGEFIVAEWTAPAGHPMFFGLYPCERVSGPILCEIMGQVASVLWYEDPYAVGRLMIFASIADAEFAHAVRPGDVCRIACEIEALTEVASIAHGSVSVDGTVVATSTFTCAWVDQSDSSQ